MEKEEVFYQRTASPEPSCVSMKSDMSMAEPLVFSAEVIPFSFTSSDENKPSDITQQFHTTASPEPSCVSMKSDMSMAEPLVFSTEVIPSSHRCSGASERIMRGSSSVGSAHCYTEAALQTHSLLEVTGDLQQDSQQPVNDVLQRVKDAYKTSMKNRYERLFEGIKVQENQTLLNRIYTQLYIIDGEGEEVNEEHEVLQMEKTPRTQQLQDTPINCNDIFKPSLEPGYDQQKQQKTKIQTVLTKGIAGIGKTVSVQKFILDWAEGKANQDVDFMFVLPFRELNLIKDNQYSLHRLLLDFYPELQDLNSKIYNKCKVVFIWDGLDESRITLMFSDSKKVSDVTETSSVGVLMSNLIKGELLPSALIWITSRPAAANQIPSKYINRVTEIQGFTDPQKEEYFRKRISDQHQANRIISHIRTVRSLHIMCHIPVFCWISATVLQNILKQDQRAEIPKTLTEMYIHFLLIQINMRNQKYEERDPEKFLQSNREMILKLAELAFRQLMEGNVMFYEEDLGECGIDVTEASVYSGICTEIFKEESVIYQRKVYCFIHLSFQEFLAALYLFYFYAVKKLGSLLFLLSGATELNSSLKISLGMLLKAVVDKTIQSNKGNLDLLFRFLLGISLESNQRLLQDLLTHTENSSETIKETIAYITDKLKNEHGISPDRSINLFHCLFEMNDQTLYRGIQQFLKSEKHSKYKLSAAQCTAIAYMLQISEEVLDELDLKKYNTSEEGRRRLIPAVRNCRKALLDKCNFTDQCCESVASVLQSSNSLLRDLDLSNNYLQDSGVKLLSDALKSPNCKLKILRLSGCLVTEEGCSYLALALSLNPSHLRKLDLSYNHPGDSGVKLLSERLNDPHCSLEILNVEQAGEFNLLAKIRRDACGLTLDPNTAQACLSLSEGYKKVTLIKKTLYPEHPERFEICPQVLCRERLSGRCYWEVKWSGEWGVYIAVTYKGIRRKGASNKCKFGHCDTSWRIHLSKYGITACHNNKTVKISRSSPSFRRVGVYLDWPAGTLSFYSVSEKHTLAHIHTFNAKFTEPLYAGFRLYSGSTLSLCKI